MTPRPLTPEQRDYIVVTVVAAALCTLASGLVQVGIDHLRRATGLDAKSDKDGEAAGQ